MTPQSADLRATLPESVGGVDGGTDLHFLSIRRNQFLIVAVVFALLSYFAFGTASPISNSHVVDCGCYDIAAQTWYMNWAPHAIFGGANPFFTHAMNVPYGVNMAANTGMPLLGTITAPITWLLGPFASFNLLFRLAFFLSSITMYVALRRWVSSPATAAIGAAIYGFSPYLYAQSILHLNFCFICLPPLMVITLDEIIVKRRWSVRRSGITLGILAIAQYFITAEVLADFALIALITLIIVGLRYRQMAWEIRRYLFAVGAIASVLFLCVCAYPICFALFGAQHINFAPGSVYGFNTFRSDLLSPFIPTSNQFVGPSSWKTIGDGFVNATLSENAGYLGIPAVVIFGITVIFVREKVVRIFALGALIAFIFSLGPSLVVDGHTTGIWLPFSILEHLPIVQIEVPACYSFVVDLCVASVVAIGLDIAQRRLLSYRAERIHNRTSLKPSIHYVALSVTIVATLALIASLLPNGTIHSTSTGVPSYFTTAAVDQIPKGSTVLAYPYPIQRTNFAMAWQVDARFRFNIIGDYAFTPLQKTAPPGGGIGGGLIPPTLNPTFVQNLFEIAYLGAPPGESMPLGSPAEFSTTKLFLVRYNVNSVVIDNVGKTPELLVRFFRRMFRARPTRDGAITAWYNVGQYLHRKY